MSISLKQVLELVGKLDDSPGEDVPRERFRHFLQEQLTEVGQIRDFVQEWDAECGGLRDAAIERPQGPGSRSQSNAFKLSRGPSLTP